MTEELALIHQKNEKIDICFQDLCYDVKIKKKIGFLKSEIIERKILKNIDGIAKSGEITAIMGASGAGKTSLLNIVSCRIPPKGKMHSVTGSFTVNNEQYNSTVFSTFAAYVMQSDILLATMTPKECLEFAANLRLKGDAQLKAQRVEEMLDEFRLTKCQNTFVDLQFFFKNEQVGDESIKGISGGERKRTSIAVELITDPGLILLDEPTSGLDSFTAFLIVTILKNYSKQGKTVLFTIHQPNADIFDLFDKLMLLVDGKFIFQGESSNALAHFQKLGFQCPIFSTAGDYFAQIMHHDYQTETYNERCQIFYSSYEEQMAKTVAINLKERESSPVTKYGVATSFLYQFHHIAMRTKLNMFRNKLLLRGRFIQTSLFNNKFTFLLIVILGLLAIAVFWDMSETSQITPIMNRIGALFFIAMNQFMMAMQPVILTFPKERALFLKEQSSNMYSVSAYYFGRTITEMPFLIIFPVIFSVIIYWAMGLNSDGADRFFIFLLINILSNFGGNALGLQVGSLFGDVKIATALAPALFIPFVLFSGFQKNRSYLNDLPTWIGWFEFLSPLKYSLEALGTNDMDDSPMQKTIDPVELMGWELGVWWSILILFGIGLFYRLTALLSLKLLVTKLQ